ncbi:MAG: tetratricopeptide repeat protein [Bacteroidota bacterium]
MSDELKDIALAEAYLNDALSEEEKRVVEKRRQDDPDFARLVDDMDVMMAGSKAAFRQEVQEQLQELEKTLPRIPLDEAALILNDMDIPAAEEEDDTLQSSEEDSSKNRRWLYLIALLLIILAVITWALWPQPKAHEQLFAKYFEAPPVERSNSRSPIAALQQKADAAYQTGQYAAAIPLYDQLYREYGDSLSLYYLGMAQMANGNGEAAVESLNTVAELPEDIRYRQLQFYLALAHLQEGDRKAATDLLRNLDGEAAEALRQEMEKAFSQ